MRYRRGWNGLTQINPDPVFIPESMDLEVFPVPKRTRIQIVAVKKSRKNGVLWGITIGAAAAYMAAACTMQRPTAAAWVVVALSVGWMALFTAVNAKARRSFERRSLER